MIETDRCLMIETGHYLPEASISEALEAEHIGHSLESARNERDWETKRANSSSSLQFYMIYAANIA